MGVSLQEALINGPAGVAVDSNSNVYIAEIFNNVVRKIDIRTNIVTTIAGCGDKGFAGDGGPAVKAGLNGRRVYSLTHMEMSILLILGTNELEKLILKLELSKPLQEMEKLDSAVTLKMRVMQV